MDFSELRAIDSLHNEGTNTLVMGGLGWKGWFVKRGRMNERHSTHIGWYLQMVAPISTIVGLLILYSKNVLGL